MSARRGIPVGGIELAGLVTDGGEQWIGLTLDLAAGGTTPRYVLHLDDAVELRDALSFAIVTAGAELSSEH